MVTTCNNHHADRNQNTKEPGENPSMTVPTKASKWRWWCVHPSKNSTHLLKKPQPSAVKKGDCRSEKDGANPGVGPEEIGKIE
ncbi:hypothetical protein C1H46_031085 [Malus baccata]|uniref:Uncharacterized protein n=1 Tax=Malus baccata TaxID=106549 RepID=A0A540LA91_MALBA|nr:hypothetical protein C1H46_031085 [Malus baccata]